MCFYILFRFDEKKSEKFIFHRAIDTYVFDSNESVLQWASERFIHIDWHKTNTLCHKLCIGTTSRRGYSSILISENFLLSVPSSEWNRQTSLLLLSKMLLCTWLGSVIFLFFCLAIFSVTLSFLCIPLVLIAHSQCSPLFLCHYNILNWNSQLLLLL